MIISALHLCWMLDAGSQPGCALTWAKTRGCLACMQEGKVPGEDALPSFSAIQAAVGFPEYNAEAARYTVPEPDGDSAAPFQPAVQAAEERSDAPQSPPEKEVTVDFSSADGDAPGPISGDRCCLLALQQGMTSLPQCDTVTTSDSAQQSEPTTAMRSSSQGACRGGAVGSLDKELSSLDLEGVEGSDAASARNGSAGQAGRGAAEVVEPDAIVLSTSGQQQGGLAVAL